MKDNIRQRNFLKAIISFVFAIVCCLMMYNPTESIFYADDTAQKEYQGFVYEIQPNNTIKIVKYNGKSKKLTIPQKIDGRYVTAIGNFCFNGNETIKELTTPNTIMSWGAGAIQISSLEKLTINDFDPSVLEDTVLENAGGFALYRASGFVANCPKLATIIVNENENSKWFYAKDNILYEYGNDEADELIYYPGGKTDKTYTFTQPLKLGQAAFQSNQYIEKIVFKEPLEDFYTFNPETGKEDKVMTTNLVFRWCPNLKEVSFTGLTAIGGLFEYCKSLETFEIPDTVKLLEGNLFDSCTSLKEITIPKSVERIDGPLFQGCSALEKCIVYSDDIEYAADSKGVPYGYVWNSCPNVVIYCNKGSTTEAYAKMFDLNYKYISELKEENATKPVITKNLKSGTYTYKETVTLKVKAKSNDKGKVSYQWYKNTKNSTKGATKIKGATKSTYTVPSNKIGTTYYFCKVTNKNTKVDGKTSASVNSKIAKITIKPKKAVISSVKSTKSGTMVVKWKKDTKVTGYQIQYSTSSDFKDAETITIKKNKTTSTTIKKLEKNTKYYVRVREYKKVNQKNIYGSWSKVKKITTK